MLRIANLRRRGGRHSQEEAARFNRRLTLAVLGVLVLAEIAVALFAAPAVGVILLAGTGALGYLEHRGERYAVVNRARAMESFADERTEALRTDAATGLPNREMLIGELVREIARVDRYAEQLTVVVITIDRADELASLWGDETRSAAVAHVGQMLRRLSRASDFIARLDETRFASLLVRCSAEQGAAFGERLGLAVGNRPIQAGRRGRLPVYVSTSAVALQFDGDRYRGALDFLSAAGGEVRAADIALAPARRRGPAARDGHELRKLLVRDYYPNGEAPDFATSLRNHLKPNRRAG